MVELGETVGIIAAQSIGEPGTQLTMRTFHTGGIFSSKIGETILAPHDGTIIYDLEIDDEKLITKFYEKTCFTLKEKTIKIFRDQARQSLIKLPKYTMLFKKPFSKVKEKEIIAEIHITKVQKKVKKKVQKDIVEIKSKNTGEVYVDKSFLSLLTGNLINKSILYKIFKRSSLLVIKNLKVKMYPLRYEKINLVCLKCISFLNIQSSTSYFVQSKSRNFLLMKKLVTEKKIFFKLKNIFKIGKVIQKGKVKKAFYISIHPSQLIEKRFNSITLRKIKLYLNFKLIKQFKNLFIKKNRILFHLQKKTFKTSDIVQGLPKIDQLLENKKTINMKKIFDHPQDKLIKFYKDFRKVYVNKVAVRKSVEQIQNYLITQIQGVYQSQGVNLSDKHMEIIVKQMTSYVIVCQKGQSSLLVGELIELNKVEKLNLKFGDSIIYEPLIMGISQISLNNKSFISEASFQETTKILVKSALKGRVDWLYGLKENIVLSNLIPVGSSFNK